MPEGAVGDVSFRRATDQDWPAIWPIVRAVVSAGDTYMFSPDLTEDAARRTWLFDGADRHVTYVGKIDSRIVATARLKPNHAGPGDHVANAAWMVSPDVSGKGVGRRFGEFVLAEARRLGFSGMQFNAVVASNERAIRLWTTLGFGIVGTVPDAFRHPKEGLVPIHVMYRPI
jgi:GNAT superfamily N-acetyltransferase